MSNHHRQRDDQGRFQRHEAARNEVAQLRRPQPLEYDDEGDDEPVGLSDGLRMALVIVAALAFAGLVLVGLYQQFTGS